MLFYYNYIPKYIIPITSIPLQLHHYNYTTTITPLHIHHYTYTITPTQLRLHHYDYTIIITQLQLQLRYAESIVYSKHVLVNNFDKFRYFAWNDNNL